MAFGIDTGISREQAGSAQVAEQIGPSGEILDMTTHGAATETVTEEYDDASGWASTATNGQSGTDVITADAMSEVNTDYAKRRITHRVAGAAPATA